MRGGKRLTAHYPRNAQDREAALIALPGAGSARERREVRAGLPARP